MPLDTNGDRLYNYLRIDVPLQISVGGTFTVRIVLNDDLDLARLTEGAVTSALSAGSQQVSVSLDGSDIYNGGVDGPYFAHVHLLDGQEVLLSSATQATAAYKFTDFQPFDAAFVSPTSDRTLDNDSDGLADWIDLTLTVQVATTGSYTLASLLTDSSYTVSSTWTQVRQLAPGKYSLEQLFLGYPIRLTGKSGPYMVTNSLYDSRGGLIDFLFLKTAAYSYTVFETPPGWFTSPYSDRGVDSDGDGLFNHLRVDIGLGFEAGGDYILSGRLLTSGGSIITDATVRLTVVPGTMVASVWFQGSWIFASGADGPYRVELKLYDSVLRRIDERAYATASYSHLQFQPKLLYFDPPHRDAGVDFDRDGKYDVLRLTLGVYFNVPGVARVVAGLQSGTGGNFTQVASVVSFPAGFHAMDLDVNGSVLLAAGVSPPYYVHLTAFDANGNLVDMDQFRTSAYALSDFEWGARGRIVGLQRDVGVDVDGDGLFNQLRLDLALNVTPGGRYRLTGSLSKGSSVITSTQAVLDLGPGASTGSLAFSGRQVRAAGLGGPYNASVSLAEANSTVFLDSRTLVTSAYPVSSFEVAAGARLSGLVRTELTGLPLSNASVWLFDYVNQDSHLAATDALGRYALPLYEGRYWAVVDHPAGQARAFTVDLAGNTSLDIALGMPHRTSVEGDAVWTGWDTVLLGVRYAFEADGPALRFRLDWWNGNRDGWVEPSELAALSVPPDRLRGAVDDGITGTRLQVNGIDYVATGPLALEDRTSGATGDPLPPALVVERSFASRTPIGTPARVALALETYLDNITIDYGTWLSVPGSYRVENVTASGGVLVYTRNLPFLVEPSPLTAPNGPTLASCEMDLLRAASLPLPAPAPPSGLIAAGSGSSVALAWQRPTQDVSGGPLGSLAGYHVYRATSTSGPFVRLDARLVLEETYFDSPGAGVSFYAVSAVNTDGVEGPRSAAVASTVSLSSATLSLPPGAGDGGDESLVPLSLPAPFPSAVAIGILAGAVALRLAVALRRRFRPRGRCGTAIDNGIISTFFVPAPPAVQ